MRGYRYYCLLGLFLQSMWIVDVNHYIQYLRYLIVPVRTVGLLVMEWIRTVPVGTMLRVPG